MRKPQNTWDKYKECVHMITGQPSLWTETRILESKKRPDWYIQTTEAQYRRKAVNATDIRCTSHGSVHIYGLLRDLSSGWEYHYEELIETSADLGNHLSRKNETDKVIGARTLKPKPWEQSGRAISTTTNNKSVKIRRNSSELESSGAAFCDTTFTT